MSAIISNNAFYTSESPTKPGSPSSPTTNRSYMSLAGQDGRMALQPLKYQQYTPIEPPAGMSYSAFLRTWTDENVSRWLNEIRCGCHEESFRTNDIRGDVLLELDQITLKEMGISSIGDRLRILNAVKVLRQRVSGKAVSSAAAHRSKPSLDSNDSSGNKPSSRRLENVRPAPLQLNQTTSRGDLPGIMREQAPDSARTAYQPVRPLPMPQQSTPPSNTQLNTPSSAHSIASSSHRANLPPLPPPPRGPAPLPPGRTGTSRLPAWSNAPPDAPAYPPPLPPQNQSTPNRPTHLPADPRPVNTGVKPLNRSISPAPPAPARLRPNPTGTVGVAANGRGSAYGASGSPSKRPAANAHPYANAQSSLHVPATNLASNLSPIDESFSLHASASSTPSPPSYSVGRGPFNPSNNTQYSLDDLRRKLVKFVLPDEGLSFTIDVASCNGGVEVLEKVLKKFGKGSLRSDGNMDVSQTDEGGLTVDGWGVFMDMGQEDGPGMSTYAMSPRTTLTHIS